MTYLIVQTETTCLFNNMSKHYHQFAEKVIPILLENGWIEKESKKHRRFECLKNNMAISFSCSPSDCNAHRQTYRNIRRADVNTAEKIKKLGLY